MLLEEDVLVVEEEVLLLFHDDDVQVSRRLGRTLHSDLRKRKLGYVRVAVETYRVLLQACDNRFARLYAQDLLIAFPVRACLLYVCSSL
jgi:hypothetical protein